MLRSYDVYLSEGIDVEGVVVTHVEPLVTAEPDKITYNLKADPESATSTTLEMLRKVPMLSIDGDDKVRMNGETSYKVLVNGRTSTMVSNNFNDVVKSMPASSLKSIEVITNPPTKYDADGTTGVINIITDKGGIDGFNGNINIGGNQYGGYNGGAYVAIQRGKFAISTNLYMGHNVNKGHKWSNEATYFESDDYHTSSSQSSSNSESNFGNFSLEASYEIDTLNLITLSGRGYMGGSNNENSGATEYLNILGVPSQALSSMGSSENSYGALSGSINYQKSFKKPDKTFTLSYNYDNNPSFRDYISIITGEVNYDSLQTMSNNRAYSQEHTAQIDYFDPINEKHHLEVGAKYILRTNYSDSDVSEREDDTQSWQDAPDRVNDLDYDQHIASLYGGYIFKHKKFTAKGGFRAELGINEGVSKSEDGDFSFTSDPLFNIVPYANVSLMMDGGQSLNLSYTQRLNRPSIWYLNPYVNDYDPMNISYGNPDLETVVSNSVSGGYRKTSQRWSLFFNGTVYLTNNSIERVTFSDENGVTESTYQNIGKRNNYRLNGSFSYRMPRYNIYVNSSLSYTDIRSTTSSLSNSGLSYSSSVGSSVKLWKDANITINGSYNAPTISLQSRNSHYYYYAFGLTQKFLKQRLTISANASNPFEKSRIFTYTTFDDSFSSYGESISMTTRQFRLSASYRFGKTTANVKRTRRTINNDDKMSGGGSSGE